MDTSGAERVLALVGKENFPSDLDKAALVRALDLCAQWHQEALRYTSDKAEIERVDRLSAISKTARRLNQLIAEDDNHKLYVWDSIRASLLRSGTDPDEAVRRIVQAAEHALRMQDQMADQRRAYQLNLRKWSPFEWLVGRWLAMAYMELGFRDVGSLKALVSKDSPYLRFVSAVLKELDITRDGKPYSPQSIIKAVKLPFAGKVRRKGSAVARDDYAWWRRQLLIKAIRPEAD